MPADIARGKEKQETVELSVVVISWNTSDMLRQCLDSVDSSAGALSYEIILVDNASSDGSVEMVRELFPYVRVIENQENVGFPKAVNQGIDASTGRYIGLLNSDCLALAGSLEKLCRHLFDNPHVGAVAPQLKGPSGHLQYSGGFAPSPASAFSQLISAQALFGGRSHGLFVRSRSAKKPMPVDWLSGTCIVVRREAIENAGKLDDKHFMYAEDLEYGLRLRRAGWQLHIVPWINAIHYGGVSTAKIPEAKLLWLGALFRIAAQELSRPQYFAFGTLLSASYLLRYVMLKMASIFPLHAMRGQDEVLSRKDDIGLFARTAFRLSLRHPSAASDFCLKAEEACRQARLGRAKTDEVADK